MVEIAEKVMRVGPDTRLVGPDWLKSKRRRAMELACVANPVAIGLISAAVLGSAFCVRRIDGHNPIIGLEHRYFGEGEEKFRLLKIRTMHPGSEGMRNLVAGEKDYWEVKGNDPRVLPQAAWLRKSGVDELPQMLNVLRSEMSLIGPRPVSPDEWVRYMEPNLAEDPYRIWKSMISRVRYGITGLWQVLSRNGDFGERIGLDVLFMRQATMASDLRILGLTLNPRVLFRGK